MVVSECCRDGAATSRKKRRKERAKLSFEDPEDVEDESLAISKRQTGLVDDEQSAHDADGTEKPRFVKDPNINTAFLPDRDREGLDRAEREELRKEWLTKQESIKEELIESPTPTGMGVDIVGQYRYV